MNQPFHFSENPLSTRLGGVARLRATLSKYILTNQTTKYIVPSISHKFGPRWIMELDSSFTDFDTKLISKLNEFGHIQDTSIILKIYEEGYSFTEFMKDFESLYGNNLTVEITLHNTSIIYLHQVLIEYEYNAARLIEDENTYTVTIRPAKRQSYPIDLIKTVVIKEVESLLTNGSILKGYNIFVHTNGPSSIYDYLTNDNDNIDSAKKVTSSIIYRLVSAPSKFFLFVRLQGTPFFECRYIDIALQYSEIKTT
jgi:hypothetical protein